MVPLTEQEQQIKIRGDNDEDAIYNRSLDDGSFRLRPGMRIQSPSLSDEDDALYVPKVGKHRAAIIPTAKAAMDNILANDERAPAADEVSAPSEAPDAVAQRRDGATSGADESAGRVERAHAPGALLKAPAKSAAEGEGRGVLQAAAQASDGSSREELIRIR